MSDEKLILYDEDGGILSDDYSSDEEAGLDPYSDEPLTREVIKKEGTILDKFLGIFISQK